MTRCPRCKREKKLTRHHIFSRRHFGHIPKLRKKVIKLCRECHDILEERIPFEKQPLDFYERIVDEVVFGLGGMK